MIQRVTSARVRVGERVVGEIARGLLVLLGVGREDTDADVRYVAGKIRDVRVFESEAGKPMDRSVADVGGAVLVVSQFTLYGDIRKGRRPSFDEAASPELARSDLRGCRERIALGRPRGRDWRVPGDDAGRVGQRRARHGARRQQATILMRHRLLCVAALVLQPVLAFAQQRPLVTEDPETIGAGRVLVEAGLDYGRSVEYPASGLEGNLLRFPLIGVSVGVSSIAEIQIDGGLYNHLSITSREPAPLSGMVTATGDSTSSVEDFVIGTKMRIAGETDVAAVFRSSLCHQAPERVERERPRSRYHRLLCVSSGGQDRPVGPHRRQRRPRHPGLIPRGATSRTTCWPTGCRLRGR